MTGSALLQENVGVVRSRVGAAYPGSHAIFRGRNLHQDLRHLDWIDLYAYGILGRRLAPQQIQMLHAIWVNTSYPDTRLWNNRVAALAGSVRSSANLGMLAAVAVSEADVYGGKAGLRAFDFLKRARVRVHGGEDLQAVVADELRVRRIFGYGRPINSVDERLPFIMELAAQNGLAGGAHLLLAFEVEKVLLQHYPKLRVNYAAIHPALVADMGLTMREYQLLRFPTFLAGMAPCLVDAAEKPVGTLFPTRCDAVVFVGEGPRPWPTGS